MLGLASTVSSSSTPESLYSVIFDGAGDYIELGDNLDLGTADFSISFWAYVPEGTSQNFISKFEDSGNRWFITTQGSDKLQFLSNVSSSTTMSNSYSGDAVPENEWFHGVVTCDRSDASGGLTVYVNAVAGTANAADATTLSNSGDLRFGRQNTSYIGANSKMADVAIWNVALNLANVQAIYNSGRPTNLTFDSGNYDNSSALQAYYRMGNGTFDDKANGVVHDQHAFGFGSEMVTNGHFDTNVSGWTQHLDNASSITQGAYGGRSGVARVVVSSTGTTDRFRQDITWEKDCLYYFSVDVFLLSGKFRIDGADGTIIGAGPGSGADVLGTINYDAAVDDRWRTLTGYAQALRTGGTDQVWIRSNGIAAEFYIDNFSIKKLNGLPGLTAGDTAFSSDTP